MKQLAAFLLPMIFISSIAAQPNCNVYLWEGDTLQYKACELSMKVNDYYQFDMKAIAIMDSCLSICPYYAFAHYEKAVVYLKAGDFIGWDNHINSAVKYEPTNYLGLRASCRGKFFADYTGAINDIDSLDSIVDYDIGFVHDGAYHLDAYKALCYKALGEYEKAIDLFEKHLIKNSDYTGLFDYIHLGVAYQKMGNHSKAIDCFSKQELINNLAENNFYKAISYLELNNIPKYKEHLAAAENLLDMDQKMLDGFHIMEDQIFLSDLKNLKKIR